MPAARFEARVPAMSPMILPQREGQLKWWLLSYQGFSENSKKRWCRKCDFRENPIFTLVTEMAV
jgi:hypothetical protein